MKNLHQGHDKLALQALKDLRVVRELITEYLPESLVSRVNFDSLRLYPSKLVSPQYKKFEADVVYEMQLQKQTALLLLHVEHFSEPDRDAPLRVWQYILLLLQEYRNNHPDQPLPLVYPLIWYTGKTPYAMSTDLFELFGEAREEAKNYLLRPLPVIDVCRLEDEDLKRLEWLGIVEYAFKYRHYAAFAAFVEDFLPWLHRIDRQDGASLAKFVLQYVMEKFTSGDADVFLEKSREYLSDELQETAMTISEQLRERGRHEGFSQGVAEGVLQGMAKGRMEGRMEGRAEGEHNILLYLLKRKFSSVPEGYLEKMAGADEDELLTWSERVLFANSIDEVFAE